MRKKCKNDIDISYVFSISSVRGKKRIYILRARYIASGIGHWFFLTSALKPLAATSMRGAWMEDSALMPRRTPGTATKKVTRRETMSGPVRSW